MAENITYVHQQLGSYKLDVIIDKKSRYIFIICTCIKKRDKFKNKLPYSSELLKKIPLELLCESFKFMVENGKYAIDHREESYLYIIFKYSILNFAHPINIKLFKEVNNPLNNEVIKLKQTVASLTGEIKNLKEHIASKSDLHDLEVLQPNLIKPCAVRGTQFIPFAPFEPIIPNIPNIPNMPEPELSKSTSTLIQTDIVKAEPEQPEPEQSEPEHPEADPDQNHKKLKYRNRAVSLFEDGQKIRGIQFRCTKNCVGTFDAKTGKILYNGVLYKTNEFANEHRHGKKVKQPKFWHECECEVDGKWVKCSTLNSSKK